jgi:hypothetical protein
LAASSSFGVHLAVVAHALEVLVAVQRVVVEGDLGVERHHFARLRHHHRVDLDDGAVQLDEGAVHGVHELHEARDLLAFQAEAEGQLAAVEAADPGGGVHGDAQDLLGVVLGHLLDLHAALGAGHDDDARGVAVHQQGQVQLAGDVAAGLDIDAGDQLALGAGLLGDEHGADHGLGCRAGLLGRLGEAHAALAVRVVAEAPCAAAAGMDLGLHHVDRAGKLLRRFLGLLGRPGDMAVEHRDAVAPQQLLALVFVDVHPVSSGWDRGKRHGGRPRPRRRVASDAELPEILDQLLHRVAGLVEGGLLGLGELHLDDALHTLLADHDGTPT